MVKLLFRNRWIALAWMLGTLLSVGLFFSAGGGHGKFTRMASDMASGKQTGIFSPDPDWDAAEADLAEPDKAGWGDLETDPEPDEKTGEVETGTWAVPYDAPASDAPAYVEAPDF